MSEGIKLPVTDWQRAALEDAAQFRFVVAGRQSGKSQFEATDAVVESTAPRKGLSILLSRGERQSLELMEKCKVVSQALGASCEATEGFFEDTSLLQHTITYPNGSRIIGLPANPDTARGYSGNVYLDEFGLHQKSKEIWQALAPSATRGFRITVASTFKGKSNKFYELAKTMGLHEGVRPASQPVRKAGWSGHWVDIHMSAEQTLRALGLRIDVQALREAIADEEIWLQEFENVPMGDSEQYIDDELVLACESSEASVVWDGQSRPGLCAGFDVARSRDLSVIILGYELGDVVVVAGMVLMPVMKFADQRKIAEGVAAAVEAGGGRFAVDATGIGAQIAEELHDKYPCVEPVNFASTVPGGAKDDKGEDIKVPVKNRMAGELKRRYEEKLIRIPESQALRRAHRAVKRYVGLTGAIRLDAARTDGGHADEFWALALMVSAATGPRNYVPLDEGALVGQPMTAGLMGRVF